MRADPTLGETTAPVSTGTGKLNVFISYSRKDLEFADQLVAALDAFGFTTTIDRKGIHGAENWERRLGQLILEADTVVFVLTPASAESPVCKWEVDQALELKKRIIPVLAAPLGGAKPHEHLQDLNYIHFYPEPSVPDSGFGSGLARLTAALSVDVEWMREHTRLSALVARWSEERPADLLVRGSELARLQKWRDSRPANAPDLTTLQRSFLQASEEAEGIRASEERKQLEERRLALEQAADAQREREKALKTLSRRTILGLVGLALLAILSGVAAVVAYQQNLGLRQKEKELQLAGFNLEQKDRALQQTGIQLKQREQALRSASFRLVQKDQELQRTSLRLNRQEQELQRASLRLREGMKLRIANTDRVVSATEKWYRIATDYKLAIGIYYGRHEFELTPTPKGTGFLVKGGSLRDEWKNQILFLTASHVVQGGGADFSQSYLVLPGVDESKRLGFKEILFESKFLELDVAVLRLSGSIPPHALPVELAGQIEEKEMLDGIAVLHWTAKDGFSLGFGHGISKPPSGMVQRSDRMYYTHVTGPGASGAPVFDASSGNVVCLHQGGTVQNSPPFAFCTSISRIVAAISAR